MRNFLIQAITGISLHWFAKERTCSSHSSYLSLPFSDVAILELTTSCDSDLCEGGQAGSKIRGLLRVWFH